MSWTSVNDQMPEDNKIVLLVVRGPLRSYHALGKHLCRYQQGLSGWDELEGDYREEDDEYYWPAGWYEQAANDEEFDFFQITNTVTHWSEVPVLPTSEAA
ncbi:MAG TPA: DUF551 domain-containing protein [Gammaproteobacteria bacterium]|nr:DUF551 domain-containing protein [Gammaproteobacteria bacterium]